MASWSKKSSSWKTSKPGRKGMARKKRKNTRGKAKSARRRYGSTRLVCPTTWHGLKVKKAKGGRCYVLREKGTTPRARFVKKVDTAHRTWSADRHPGKVNTSSRSSGSYLRGLRNKRKGSLRGVRRTTRRRYRRR